MPSAQQYESPNGLMTPPASQSPPSSQERTQADAQRGTAQTQVESDTSSEKSAASAYGKRTRTESFGTQAGQHEQSAATASQLLSPNPRHRKSVRKVPSTPTRASAISSTPSRLHKDATYAAPIPGVGLSPFKSVLAQPGVDGSHLNVTHFRRPRYSSAEPGTGHGEAVSFSATKIRTKQLQFALAPGQGQSDSSGSAAGDSRQEPVGAASTSMDRSPSQSEAGSSQVARSSKSRKKTAAATSTSARRSGRGSVAPQLPGQGKKLSRRSTFGRSNSWAAFSTPPATRGMRVMKDIAQPESPSDDPLLLYASHCAEWDYGAGSPSFSRSRVLKDVTLGNWNEIGTMTEEERREYGVGSVMTEAALGRSGAERANAATSASPPNFLRTQSMFDPVSFGGDDEPFWQPGHAEDDGDSDEGDHQQHGNFDSSVAANVFQDYAHTIEEEAESEEESGPADDEDGSRSPTNHEHAASADYSCADKSETMDEQSAAAGDDADDSYEHADTHSGALDFETFLENEEEEDAIESSIDSVQSGPVHANASASGAAFEPMLEVSGEEQTAELEDDGSLQSDERTQDASVVEQKDTSAQQEVESAGSVTQDTSPDRSAISDSGQQTDSTHASERTNGTVLEASEQSTDSRTPDVSTAENVPLPAQHELNGSQDQDDSQSANGSNTSSELAAEIGEMSLASLDGAEADVSEPEDEDEDAEMSDVEVEQSLFVSRMEDADEDENEDEDSDAREMDDETSSERASAPLEDEQAEASVLEGDVSMHSQAETNVEHDSQDGEDADSDNGSMASDEDLPAPPTETPRRNSLPTMLPDASAFAPFPLLSTPQAPSSASSSAMLDATTSPSPRRMDASASPGTLQRANSSASLLLLKSNGQPVIQISSLDPRAAAKAAAILKLHYQYVEEGFSHEEVDASELKKYGLSVRDIRGLAARDVSDLPNVLADEELKELERQKSRYGRAQQRQTAHSPSITHSAKAQSGKGKMKEFSEEWLASSSSDGDKLSSSPLTPHSKKVATYATPGSGKSPATPRLPGAWVWTPAKPVDQPIRQPGSARPLGTGRRSPSKRAGHKLEPDPLVWELAEWSALDRVFRHQVREHAVRLLEASELGHDGGAGSQAILDAAAEFPELEISGRTDSLTTRKIKAHCLAVLNVEVEKVFTLFVQKHSIMDSQLHGMWSSHRFATRIAALQRRYLERIDKHYRGKQAGAEDLALVEVAHAELTDMHEPLNAANRSAEREGVLRLNASELSIDSSRIATAAAPPTNLQQGANGRPMLPTEDSMDFSLGTGRGDRTAAAAEVYHSTPARGSSGRSAMTTQDSKSLGRRDLRRAVLQRTFGANHGGDDDVVDSSAASGKSARRSVNAIVNGAENESRVMQAVPGGSTPVSAWSHRKQAHSQAAVAAAPERLTPAQRLRMRLDAAR